MWRAILRRRTRQEALDKWDVCIVSYPKTGRTWLRMMVGKYLCLRYGLDESQVLDTPLLSESAGLPVTGFTHGGSALAQKRAFSCETSEASEYGSRRVVLLTRCIEDAMVSAYFQVTQRLQIYSGSLSEFLRDDRFGVERYLKFYKFWEQSQHVPQHFTALSYEQMHFDAAGALKNVLTVMRVADIDDHFVKEAVNRACFESMQSIEQSQELAATSMRTTDPLNPDSRKVRRGVVGGYVDYLTSADLILIQQQVTEANCLFVKSLSLSSIKTPNAA